MGGFPSEEVFDTEEVIRNPEDRGDEGLIVDDPHEHIVDGENHILRLVDCRLPDFCDLAGKRGLHEVGVQNLLTSRIELRHFELPLVPSDALLKQLVQGLED